MIKSLPKSSAILGPKYRSLNSHILIKNLPSITWLHNQGHFPSCLKSHKCTNVHSMFHFSLLIEWFAFFQLPSTFHLNSSCVTNPWMFHASLISNDSQVIETTNLVTPSHHPHFNSLSHKLHEIHVWFVKFLHNLTHILNRQARSNLNSFPKYRNP